MTNAALPAAAVTRDSRSASAHFFSQTGNRRRLQLTLVSSHLVDIFATVPQNTIPLVAHTTVNTLSPAQDATSIQYLDVLAKLSTSDPSSKSNPYPIEHTPITSESWDSDDDDLEELKGQTLVNAEGIKSLLGGFEDADLAMK